MCMRDGGLLPTARPQGTVGSRPAHACSGVLTARILSPLTARVQRGARVDQLLAALPREGDWEHSVPSCRASLGIPVGRDAL